MSVFQWGSIRTISGEFELAYMHNPQFFVWNTQQGYNENFIQRGRNISSILYSSVTNSPQDILTLPNGKVIKAVHTGANDSTVSYSIDINIYDNSNNLIGSLTSISINKDGTTTETYLCLYRNEQYQTSTQLVLGQVQNKIYVQGNTQYICGSSVGAVDYNLCYSELHNYVEDYHPYNYEPINYITGNNKTLKLSMIKAINTNHGESVTDGQTTDIQRFTDATNMRVFCSNMVENDEKVLGYTSSNNYVTVTKGYVDGNGAYTVTFKYYINGVYQSALDHTARVTSESIQSEPIWTPYYSLLLDTEHSACRPSRIYLNEQTNTVRYNDSENDQNVITDANQSLWFEWLASGYHTDTTDPYDYGGNSTPDSGDGQWDNSSENIDIPSIPTVSISNTGFVSVFNPTLSQVKALADYMWAGAFDVSLFRKVMSNPMDSIIGFALIPCEPTVSGVDTVKVGNIDTGISMNAVSNQFVDVDCGTLDLEECWGNYLDYAPYTKITLVLPFIGSVHLSPDDCMKKKIGIKYRIDILSGGCVAYVTCDGSVMYQFTGSCSAQLPITNLDYRGMISALISIGTTAIGVGSAIASGGITAPMVAVGVGNTANNVMNGKPNIQHGGSLGSTSGFLGTRIPYLIITRPRQCVPTGVNKFKGLPSLITSKLKNVTGFTQVHDIHLDALPCSDAEKTELRSILESGVIV